MLTVEQKAVRRRIQGRERAHRNDDGDREVMREFVEAFPDASLHAFADCGGDGYQMIVLGVAEVDHAPRTSVAASWTAETPEDLRARMLDDGFDPGDTESVKTTCESAPSARRRRGLR